MKSAFLLLTSAVSTASQFGKKASRSPHSPDTLFVISRILVPADFVSATAPTIVAIEHSQLVAQSQMLK